MIFQFSVRDCWRCSNLDAIDCEPILGYLYTGMEKIAENQTLIQYTPYVTKLGLFSYYVNIEEKWAY